jgi:hypothetical protein
MDDMLFVLRFIKPDKETTRKESGSSSLVSRCFQRTHGCSLEVALPIQVVNNPSTDVLSSFMRIRVRNRLFGFSSRSAHCPNFARGDQTKPANATKIKALKTLDGVTIIKCLQGS